MPVNLLTQNQWALEDGAATGYTAVAAPDYTPSIYTGLAADTAQKYSGTYSLKAQTLAGSVQTSWETPTGTSGFPVTPGVGYNISARVRVNDSGVTLRASMRWYDSGGSLLSTTHGNYLASPNGSWGDRSWPESGGLGGTMVAPVGAAFGSVLWLSSTMGSGISHWLDEVGVYASNVTTPIFYDPSLIFGRLKINAGTLLAPDIRTIGCAGGTGPDLVPNGDFEIDVSGWAADDLVGGPSTFARSTAWSSSGVASFEATGFGGNGSWFKSTAYIPVTPGADYDLTAVFKRIGGTTISGWHFGLAFYTDTSGTHVSGPQYEWDTPGGSISDGPVGGTVTAPADAAFARVFFRAIGTAALYYVDDITLVRTLVPGLFKLYAAGQILREVCDDDPGANGYATLAYPGAANTVSVYRVSGTPGEYYALARELDNPTLVGRLTVKIGTVDADFTYLAGDPAGLSVFTCSTSGMASNTISYVERRKTDFSFLGDANWSPSTVVNAPPDPAPERRPIEIPLPGGVTTAVCMTPIYGWQDVAPTSGWFSLAGGDSVEEPTAVYRTDPARSARLYGPGGTGNYALTVTGLIVGHTYRIGCYVRQDAAVITTTSDAFFHARYAAVQTNDDINPMSLATWQLAEATFVADSTTDDLLWQIAAANASPPYDFSVWIADWYVIDEGP